MASVFELHEQDSPTLSIRPSVSLVSSSTPVKITSHHARSEKKEEVTELLWSEMANGGWVKDDRILERFKSNPTPNAYAAGCNIAIPHTVAKEEELYGPLVDYVNALIQGSALRFINSFKYFPKQSRSMHKESGKEDTNKSQLKPDLLGLHSDAAESFEASVEKPDGDTWLYWRLVHVFWEVKQTNTAGDWLAAREQSATYARQVFINHPGRRFVYGVVWCHPSFEVWLYDRSGGLVSERQDFFTMSRSGGKPVITENSAIRDLFSRVITSLSKFSMAEIGYDPAVALPPVDPSRRPAGKEPHAGIMITFFATKEHVEETFTIERELFYRSSLRGRGTQIWLVKRTGDEKLFVLKDSWRESHRCPEWEWYDQVDNKEHLPKLHRVCTVTIGDTSDTTELCRGTCGITDSSGKALERVQRRIHDRLLFNTHGLPLTECKDVAELLRTVCGAVRAHRALYQAGILHRDVSVNNILIDKLNRTGILIDLDLAAKVDTDGGVASHTRSGTLMFMASDVLAGLDIGQKTDPWPPFRHSVVHDLESFVWVLLYISVSTPDYEDAQKLFATMLRTGGSDEVQLGLAKFNFWSDTVRSWTKMGNLLKLHPLWSTINSLHDAIDECRALTLADRSGHYPALYDKFVNILETAATSPNTLKFSTNRKRPFDPAPDRDEMGSKTKRFKTTITHITPPQKLRARDNPVDYEELSDSEYI